MLIYRNSGIINFTPQDKLKSAFMENIKNNHQHFRQIIIILAGIISSGICWYLSNGLSGDYWYLIWLAPVPVLVISLRVTGKMAFIISFIAYLIGRLSWFSYLISVATLIPAIIFTIAFALFFSLIITISRVSVLKSKSWYSVLAFPVFFTSFEFLLMKFSPDGSAGSIAYSQSDVLPVIQLVSLTGILGITFLITYIPSALATVYLFRKEAAKIKPLLVFSSFLVLAALLYGVIRIVRNSDENMVKAGLVVLEEKQHDMSAQPDFEKELQTTGNYMKEISNLASKGAKIVVLPERAININNASDPAVINLFKNTARDSHVLIVSGFTDFRHDPERNVAMIFTDEGKLVNEYSKVHLVTGLERQFKPGSEIGLFNFNGIKTGVAICKDLDFQDYIIKYGKNQTEILFIPAWDFVVDDWLHSRMAILRGVENGFSEVRAARQGRLTISDCYGRVKYETSSARGQSVSLIGEVSLQSRKTIYSQFGEWFGILNLVGAIFFISQMIFKRK
jgi:apolipoprotein N-acyltransferase